MFTDFCSDEEEDETSKNLLRYCSEFKVNNNYKDENILEIKLNLQLLRQRNSEP